MLLFLYTAFVVILVYFINLRRKKRYEEFWKYIFAIPGPKTYPVIGSVDIYMKDAVSLFEIARKRSKLYFPIYKVWSFNISVVFLFQPADIEMVLTNMKHLSKGFQYDALHVWLNTGLLTSTDAKWQKRRKILTPAFHFSILQKFIDIFNKETDHLVQVLTDMSDLPSVNVLEPITEFTLNSIGETSLGVNMKKEHNINAYKSAIHNFGYFFTYRLVRPWLRLKFIYNLSSLSRSVDETVKTLHEFSTAIIEKRKKLFVSEEKTSYSDRKRMAMLDLLLKAKYQDGVDIDDEGIREEVDTFMFEGHDTTSLALCYILLVLANESEAQEEIFREIQEILGSKKHPDSQDLSELKYMERCIKECLRLFPSVPMISRVLGEQIKTTSGYTIPKGATVSIVIHNMHRHPEIWNDPEKFDPDRFLPENIATRHPFSYLPFSAGPRNCIGQRFALFEMKAALCGILRNFKLKPVDTYHDIKIKADLVLRPSSDIKVKFETR